MAPTPLNLSVLESSYRPLKPRPTTAVDGVLCHVCLGDLPRLSCALTGLGLWERIGRHAYDRDDRNPKRVVSIRPPALRRCTAGRVTNPPDARFRTHLIASPGPSEEGVVGRPIPRRGLAGRVGRVGLADQVAYGVVFERPGKIRVGGVAWFVWRDPVVRVAGQPLRAGNRHGRRLPVRVQPKPVCLAFA
jgi:hypothetical protein